MTAEPSEVKMRGGPARILAVPALALSGVEVTYRTGTRVGPVTLDVPRGRVLGLVGGNGAGKTTLLKVVCGLIAPQRGTAHVLGDPVNPGRVPAGLGAMIEEPPVFGWATGAEHLLLAAVPNATLSGRIEQLLSDVGLGPAGHQRVSTYSQGMRQRLGIARALLGDPELLVLDEPSNGLDPQGVQWLRGLLRNRVQDNKTVIVSSHMLAEMQLLADDVLLLAGGTVLSYIHMSALPHRPGALEEHYFSVMAGDKARP